MAHVRLGRPTFIPQLARAGAAGAAFAAVLLPVLAIVDFPDWGETVASFLSTFTVFLAVGILFRLGTHVMHAHVNHGHQMPSREVREDDLKWSGWVLGFGFASLVAWLVLRVGQGVLTGDFSG